MTLIGNLDLGNFIDTLSCKSLINFSWIMWDYPIPHALVLAVHLVNLLGWIGKEVHSKTFLSTLFLEHYFMVKSYGCWGGVGGGQSK